MKLDKATLTTLTLPPGKNEHKFFDERLPGHGVRLRHPSDQSRWRWITQYDDLGGVTKMLTHGPVSLIEPAAAFKRSKDLLAGVRLGGDPAGEKRAARVRAAETFGATLPRYLTHMRGERRPRSFKELERHLMKHARPLHSRTLVGIDRRALSGLVAAIAENNGPQVAINVHGSLSGYFVWLMRGGLIEQNPMLNTNKPSSRPSRERLITDDELRALWSALTGDDYSDIIRLLIYTGARKSEIGGLTWNEIDLVKAQIDIPSARMKNKKPHLIPLSAPALAVLQKRQRGDGEHVFGRGTRGFQGWSWGRLDLNSRIAGPRPTWVLHDFRRLISTVMHERLAVQPHIVERVLAHVGHQAGVAGTYNRSDYIVEKRRALERWAEYVESVVTGKPAKETVVQLRGKR
jgi:integrase